MAPNPRMMRRDGETSSKTKNAAPIGLRLGFVVAVSAAVIFLGIIYMAAQRGRGPGIVLRDPAASFGYSPFAGLLSHLGILAMVSAAVVCLFAAVHARRLNRLLFWVGAFTLYIAADDFMLFHKRLLPGTAVLGALGAAALAIGFRFWRDLLGRDHAALWLAICLLGLSTMTDLLAERRMFLVVEEGFKFVGLCVWSVYWISRANVAMKPHTPDATSPAAS